MAEQYEKLTLLRPFVQGSVKGVPNLILDRKILQAVQDFLKASLIWQVLLDDVPIIGDGTVAHASYQVVTPQETLPQKIAWASFQDPNQTHFRPLSFVAIDQLDRENMGVDYSTHFVNAPGSSNWRELIGAPRAITHEFDPGQARLVPIPDTGSDGALLRMQVAIFPSLKGTQIPAWIVDRYHETIAELAMQKLQEMEGELWSNPAAATRHATEYDKRLNKAQSDKAKSFTRSSLTVEPRYPIS